MCRECRSLSYRVRTGNLGMSAKYWCPVVDLNDRHADFQPSCPDSTMCLSWLRKTDLTNIASDAIVQAAYRDLGGWGCRRRAGSFPGWCTTDLRSLRSIAEARRVTRSGCASVLAATRKSSRIATGARHGPAAVCTENQVLVSLPVTGTSRAPEGRGPTPHGRRWLSDVGTPRGTTGSTTAGAELRSASAGLIS